MARRFNTNVDFVGGAGVYPYFEPGTLFLQIRPLFNSGDSIDHVFIFLNDAGVTNYFQFQKYSTNFVFIGWTTGGVSARIEAPDTGIFVSGVWKAHLFDFDDDANTQHYYVDNVLKGTSTTAFDVPAITATAFNIGAVGTSSANADLAELGRWSRVLNADERAVLQATGTPLSVPNGLIRYMPMVGRQTPEVELMRHINLNVTGALQNWQPGPRIFYPAAGSVIKGTVAEPPPPPLVISPPLITNPIQLFTPAIVAEAPPGVLSLPLISNPIQLFTPSITTVYSEVGRSSFIELGVVDEAKNLFLAANNAGATLAAAIDATAAPPFTITLTGDLSKFASSGAITIDVTEQSAFSSEILYFDGKSGQTLTITARAQDGTTAKTFLSGASVEMRHIARHHNLLVETLIAVESQVLAANENLDGKANVIHSHAISSITGLEPALDAKADDADVANRVIKSGDTMTGALTLSGPPIAPLHATSKVYVDSLVTGTTGYNVRNYGVTGNGTTDDAAAIQALIDQVGIAGGGRIYFPRGVYLIAGPIQDVFGGKCQIALPLRSDHEPIITIDFVGETTPPTWLFEGGPPQGTGYSIIKSNFTGGDGNESLIGGRKHASSTLANNVMANFKDLVIEVPPNPRLTAINLYNQTGNRIEHVLIHDGSVTEVHNQPTNGYAYGVQLAPTNQSSRIWLDNLHVFGFYTAVKLGELTQGSMIAQGCMRAVEVPWSHHPSMMEFIGAYGCAYGIVASGAGERALKVELLSMQDDTGYGQAWQNKVYDVDDASNVLRGTFTWYNVQANLGVVHTITKNGGINFIGTELW